MVAVLRSASIAYLSDLQMNVSLCFRERENIESVYH
jgi:hypothetical protein